MNFTARPDGGGIGANNGIHPIFGGGAGVSVFNPGGAPQGTSAPPPPAQQSGFNPTPFLTPPNITPQAQPQSGTIPNPNYMSRGETPPPNAAVPGQPVQSLPQGTPTQPGNVAATAPMPYQTFGGIAQVSPTMVDPANAQAYFQQYSNMLQQSMDPYFQQQQQQLNSDLRARGIQNSGAAGYLEGNLLAQQGATLAGQEAPFLSQAFGYNTQADLTNAQYGNEASLYNANAYQSAVNQNYNAYNNYMNELLGLGGSNYGALQAAYLNSFGPNTGVQGAYNTSLAGQQNVFGNVYGNAMNAQQNSMNNLGAMLAMGG